MKLARNTFIVACGVVAGTMTIVGGMPAFGQVSPTEVQNPRAKADERAYRSDARGWL